MHLAPRLQSGFPTVLEGIHVYVSLELSPHHIECRQVTVVTTSIYIAHSWLLNVLQENMNIIGHHWIRVPFSTGKSWLVSVELHVMSAKPHVEMMRFRCSEPGWFGLNMSQLPWGIASGMNISICSGENSGPQIGGAHMYQPFITPSWPQVKHSLKWHRTSTILHSKQQQGAWMLVASPSSHEPSRLGKTLAAKVLAKARNPCLVLDLSFCGDGIVSLKYA